MEVGTAQGAEGKQESNARAVVTAIPELHPEWSGEECVDSLPVNQQCVCQLREPVAALWALSRLPDQLPVGPLVSSVCDSAGGLRP